MGSFFGAPFDREEDFSSLFKKVLKILSQNF